MTTIITALEPLTVTNHGDAGVTLRSADGAEGTLQPGKSVAAFPVTDNPAANEAAMVPNAVPFPFPITPDPAIPPS